MAGIITVDTIQVDSILTKAGATQSASNLGLSGGSGQNLLINGAMQVAQRSTSETGLGASSGYHTVDRFHNSFNTSGRLTMSQETINDLPGFAKAIKLDCTTADTSIAADEYYVLQHRIEGQNLQRIKKGTSSAESLTVSFYVKGNAAATYVCELEDADNNRTINKSFSVTTSWTRVSLTFPGDTTGALNNDNALSFQIGFWLHAGSNYTSGTLQTAFGSTTAANRAVGISSFFDSTARTLFITGLQMEIGDTTSDFEHKKYSDTLLDCYRYFYRIQRTDAYGEFLVIRTYNTTAGTGVMMLPVSMRASPTFSSSTVNTSNFSYGITAIGSSGTDSSNRLNTHNAVGAFTANGAAVIQKANNTDMIFLQYDAEL